MITAPSLALIAPATTLPPVDPVVPPKKPFFAIADAYIACLLAEVIAYQKRDAAYKTMTSVPIPDRDLKAAIGETNKAHELYRERLAEEMKVVYVV